jgi:putative endonuclease
MSARSPVARLAADRRGRHAETIAAWWLRLHGYRIVGRRVRTRVGEIDLVVRSGKLLAFVEVKARDRLDNALAALHPAAMTRIAAAANALTERYGRGRKTFRIDAVIIVRGQWPRHYRDVWRGE